MSKSEIVNAIAAVELAAAKIGIDPYALGCKYLLEQQAAASVLIDTCREETDRRWHEYLRVYDMVDDNLYAETVTRYHEHYFEALKKENEAKEYRRVIGMAIKKWRETASDAENAMFLARCKVQAKKLKDAKSLPEGARTYTVLPKIKMKSYKIMKCGGKDLFGKEVMDMANAINLLLVKPENETQDEYRARCEKIKAKFEEIKKYIEDFIKAGRCYKLDAARAKINTARQSELTDAIQMPYGRTTDMMITIEHDIAKLFDNNIAFFIGKDLEEGKEMLNELRVLFADAFVENGVELKLLGRNSRTIHFKWWTANNTQLKIGEGWMLSDASFEIAKMAGQMGMSDERYNAIATSGSDALKYWSYASTPGCPMVDEEGNVVGIDDVLIVPSTEMTRVFKHVLEIAKDGTAKVYPEKAVTRTFNDGGALLIGIASQQFRGFLSMKGFGTRIGTKTWNIVDEIAQRENITTPEMIMDCDRNMKRWRDYKVIASTDCWKWVKYGVSWSEFVLAMKQVAKKAPGADLMYTARLADSIEEDDRRKMARQTTQQFANATAEQISKLVARDAAKLKSLTTLPGVIRKFAGLDKDEKDRTAYEHLIEACPEILSHPLMQEKVKEMFDVQFANACMRPSVHGCYPFLAEDPVATVKIWIFGMDPNQVGLGYLKEDEFNVPGMAEGQEFFFVRYPANQLVGMTRKNHNDEIYRFCGNVALISIDSDTIIRADGDFDGDEGSIVTDELIVELCKQVSEWAKRPLIIFPHDKVEKVVVTDKHERSMMIAKSIVIANMFGGAVGQNSNLATRCFESASIATTENARKHHLGNAARAHIAAIVAIDLAKTGTMPQWLQDQIAAVKSDEPSSMPWNQRFAKHTTTNPWWSCEWEKDLLGESLSTPNRIARAMMDKLGVDCEHLIPIEVDEFGEPTEYDVEPAKRVDISFGNVQFDINVMLDKVVKNHSTKAVVDRSMLRSIEARNYRTKEDGDDQFQLLKDIELGKVVDMVKLYRFIWRNRASMVYKVRKSKNDLSNAEMIAGYYEWCHDLMLKFGMNGSNEKFTRMSPEEQAKATANKFLKAAINCEGGIGRDLVARIAEIKKTSETRNLTKDELNEISDLEHELLVRQASYLDFTLKVFAYEYYQSVCDNKGIKNRWVKTVDTPEEQDEEDVMLNDIDEAF